MRLHRALLRLYPTGFRAEYGDEIAAIFAARRARTSGPAVMWLWLHTIVDTLVTAARVHLDIFWQDLRYTGRALLAAKGFALTAMAVTALGIGATTAAFSVTDLVLIRPLSFPDADRLVLVWERQPQYSRMEPSPPNYRDWKEQSTSFEAMGAYTSRSVNMVGGRQATRLAGIAATADVFAILNARTVLGRTIGPDDDSDTAAGTLVISYATWQNEFGSDPGVIGKTVRLDDQTYSVIGVMRPEFTFPNRDTEFWMPMRFTPNAFDDRSNHYLRVLAKLKAGTDIAVARAEMDAIMARLERAFPKDNADTRATVAPLGDEVSRQTRLLLIALFGASLCLLLIACTNLASLLVTRVIGRRGELAVRTALGAGRERLVRQMLTESLLLSMVGGALGVGLAIVALPLITRLTPVSIPIDEAAIVQTRVLLFAVVVTLATAVGFGVIPALRICRSPDMNDLRAGSRSTVARQGQRVRAVLVVAQVTASVALLIAAGLLIRALWRVQAIDPGFRTTGALAINTPLPWPKYAPTARRADFYSRVLADVRTLPGVTDAGFISYVPMTMPGGIWPVLMQGTARSTDPDLSVTASVRYITPGLFAALGVPITRGRDVSDSDVRTAPFAAVVSESFVTRYWPGEDPIGKPFKIAFFDRTVVGVVGNVRVRGLERESEPQVYLPYQQIPDGFMVGYAPRQLVVRADGDVASLAPSIRRIVASVDPELPVARVRTLQDIVGTQTEARSTQVQVLQAFAAVSLLLAGIGVHGLLSYGVAQRRAEIGLRMALGARTSDVARMVLRQGTFLGGVGAALGIGVAYAAGRQMEALLAGVTPSDPLTFALAAGLVIATTIAGSLLPALAAARVDAVTVMRS